MFGTFRDAQGNLVQATSAEHAATLRQQGLTPVNMVLDQDFRGEDVVVPLAEGEPLDVTQQQLQNTPEAVEAAQARARREQITREANTTEESLRAVGSSLASGLTFGATTAAGFSNVEGLSDETRGILRSQTENEELLGLGLSVVSPWGAEAALTRAAAGAVRGSGFLSTIGRMTLEGAGGGAITSAHETAMNNGTIEDFAERVGGDMMMGALFGGGLGVPAGAAGALARRIRGRGNHLSRAAQEAAEEGAEGASAGSRLLGEELAPRTPQTVLQRASQSITGDPLTDYTSPRVRRAVDASDEVAGWGDPQWRQAADSVGSVINRVDEASAGLRRSIDDLDLTGANPQVALGVAEDLATSSAGLRALDLGDNAAGRLQREITRLVDAEGSMANLAPREALNRALELRDSVGQAVRRAGGKNSPDLNNLREGLEELTEGLNATIRDNDWGAASESIRLRDTSMQSLRTAQEQVLERVRASSSFDNISPGNPTALRRAFREAIESGDMELPRSLLDLSEQMDALGASDILPGSLPRPAQTGATRDLLDKLSARAQDKANSRSFAERSETLQASRQVLQSGGIFGAIMGGTVGMATAGVATALGVVRSKPHLMRTWHRLKRSFGQADTQMAQSFQKVRSISRSSSPSPFVGRMRVGSGTIAATLVNGSSQEREEVYQEMVERIAYMANSPQALASAMEGKAGLAGKINPNLPGLMGMAVMMQLQALASALPRSARTSVISPRMNTRRQRPNRTEVSEFLMAAAVVEDPSFSLELLASGRLSEGAARAVAQAHPRFHQAVSGQILADLASIQQRGERLNYQASIVMSRFVGIPLDPTLEPGFNSLVTSQSAQTPAQEAAQFSRPVSTRQPDMIAQSMTPSERIQ